MLNDVTVYSTSQQAVALTFPDSDPLENDIIQVVNIDGLDPVTAAINVVSSGNVDGAIDLDASVPTRNIVLTLRANPNWNDWTYETIRKFIYSYFIPKTSIKLVFDSDEIGIPVEILGVVESCESNPFSQSPEYHISLICSDPYFTAVDPTVISGSIIAASSWTSSKSNIAYHGTVPTGIKLNLNSGFSTEIYIQAGESSDSVFHIVTDVDDVFELISIPLHKSIREVTSGDGTFTNLLGKVQLGSSWPVFIPGFNSFAVMGPSVGNPWELTFFEKYGAL